MNVLIVEDNADDRKLLRLNLERHGCEFIIEAADGEEGLEKAKEHKPDIIISDALMPKMDGFQFLRAVKTDEALKDIPFIFYSAVYTESKEAELAASLGAEKFIIKPKEPEEFWDELQGIIEDCKIKGKKALTTRLIDEDEEFLRKYSYIVAAKLEEKIKELGKAKAVIKAKEEEWETTFESIGDCISIHDTDFNLVMANKACEDLLGVCLDNMKSKKCHEMFHGMNEPIQECPLKKTKLTGKGSEIEKYEPHLNFWVNISCFPLFNRKGDLRGVVHFTRDITKRKKMEEALKESEEKYRTLVDNAIVGIYRSTLDGTFIYVNEAMIKIFECDSIEEMLKTPALARYKSPADRGMFIDLIKKEKKVTNFEIETQTKTGKLITIVISAMLEDNVISGMVMDITEHRKLEEQLRHTQKMEAIGTLAGGIAHDFNNMLNVIIGYGGLMQMQIKPDDPLTHNLKEILAAGERASHLTKGLLTFSRKQVVEVKIVNLNEIIEGFKKMIGRIIGEDIELTITPSTEDLTIKADTVQIEQVLMNLAANARYAMPKGGALTIKTKPIEIDKEFIKMHGFGEPGMHALITVSDTGTGMDEKTRERIFEPYFTTKEMGRGTGLGLSIVYGIISQHRGHINCYSEPGKGTSFRIYLPLIEPEAEKIEKEEAELPKGGSETILLAEDDAGVRKLIVNVLEGYGYKVIEAVDGEDAVEKFKENNDRVQLLLFDMIMPRKNGKEAYDNIKGLRHDIRVIFISGYTADIINKFSIEKGMEFISKPVSPTELLRRVREALDK